MTAIVSSIFKCSVFNYWMDSSDRDCDQINLPLQLEKTTVMVVFNYSGESSKTFLQKVKAEYFSTNCIKNWIISLEKYFIDKDIISFKIEASWTAGSGC